jgi:hypothetical protein
MKNKRIVILFLSVVNFFAITVHGSPKIAVCNSAGAAVSSVWFKNVNGTIRTGSGGPGGPEAGTAIGSANSRFFMTSSLTNAPTCGTTAGYFGNYYIAVLDASSSSSPLLNNIVAWATDPAESAALGARLDRCFIGLRTEVFTVIEVVNNGNLTCY